MQNEYRKTHLGLSRNETSHLNKNLELVAFMPLYSSTIFRGRSPEGPSTPMLITRASGISASSCIGKIVKKISFALCELSFVDFRPGQAIRLFTGRIAW